jgi:metallo-beta-lactamase family protein
MATVTFHGAAQEVTGSCHLLESPACGRILLDCGMRQGGDVDRRKGNADFDFDPKSIDAVVLSHGHLDHCGMLPLLSKRGFRGPIYCTRATADLLPIMLNDAAGLYLRDLERENRRARRKGKPEEDPIYDYEDVDAVLNSLEPIRYRTAHNISPETVLTFYDAGHILGSAIVEVVLNEPRGKKTLVFSGDLGRKGAVLMKDPEYLERADVVLMESTYGDRNHRCEDESIAELSTVLKETWAKGGNVMIPSFAVGRTQEILFYLGRLHHDGQLDPWTVFLDSPMAIEVTELYDRWLNILDPEETKELTDVNKESLATFLPTLKLTASTEDSMNINRVKSGAIIIAGSGMCTGGRIRHHFKQRIWDSRNSLIFIGFQAQGTLGRLLIDGVKHIKLFGDDFIVNAGITSIGCFSAHAGQSELIEWASHFEGDPEVVLVHGEASAQDALADALWQQKGIKVRIPRKGESMVF